jgi:hypothetical protein
LSIPFLKKIGNFRHFFVFLMEKGKARQGSRDMSLARRDMHLAVRDMPLRGVICT